MMRTVSPSPHSFFSSWDKLSVERMLFFALDSYHDGLVHLAADHYSYSFLTKISFHNALI